MILGDPVQGQELDFHDPCGLSMTLQYIFKAIFIAISVCMFAFLMFEGIKKDVITFFSVISRCYAY